MTKGTTTPSPGHPTHAARVIPGLSFENVKSHGLREIWESSEAFQKFRGESWMQEPCKSCDRRTQDFGGCRCQAFLLASDAAATDPVCSLSPQRAKVDAILAQVAQASSGEAAGAGRAEGAEGGRSVAPGNASVSAASLTKPDWLYRPNPS